MVVEIPPELKKEFRQLLGNLLVRLMDIEKENKELAKAIFKGIKKDLELYERHLFADELKAREEEERKKKLERKIEDGIFVDTNAIIANIIATAFQGSRMKLRGKEWWKKVTNIDFTKDNGYAFEGEFLPAHFGMKKVNINEGDVIIVYRDMGSIRHHTAHVAIIKVTKVDKENNKFEYEILAKAIGKDWAAQILANKEAVEKIKQALATKK